MEDNDKKQTLVGLLVAAVVLILAGSLLAWLGEGRKRDFEVKLLEELMASSPNSQVVKTVARGYVDDIHVWTAVEEAIPDGYSLSVEKKQNGAVLTNRYRTPPPPPGGELPPTGQLWWPVPILLVAGVVLLILGCAPEKSRGK